MKNSLIIFIIIILCSCGAFLKFHKNQEEIPFGCDEFGYMSLAKAFDEGKAYKNHVERPYLMSLLDTLRKSGITENEIQWMVVPHAYYVVPGTQQILNQYTPGTSYLLSWFSLPIRKQMFPAIGMFLMLLFPVFAFKFKNKEHWNLVFLILLLFAFYALLAAPLHTEFTRVNSLTFTFGLLIAAGLFLKDKPLFSCLFIVLATNFRIINGIMLLPLLTFVPLKLEFTFNNMLGWIKTGLKYLGVFLLAMLPYFIYVYRLRGNPLLPTYSIVDTAIGTDYVSNIKFYFDWKEGWFQFHLLVILCLGILAYFKKINLKTFIAVLLFPFLNYLFFIFHKVQINYYPYASFFILFGFFLNQMNSLNIGEKSIKFIKVATLVFPCLMLLDGAIRYQSQNHKTFESAKSEYNELCPYQVIWGDLLPSASEYVCNNNGFKFLATTPRARKMAIQFLYAHGHSQLFLISDLPVEPKILMQELLEMNLPFKEIHLNKFGMALQLIPLKR